MTRLILLTAVAVVTAACSSSDQSDDCDLIGCAPPPPCGQPCTARCGCCTNHDCDDDAAATDSLVDAPADVATDVATDVGPDTGPDTAQDVDPSDLNMSFTDAGCLDWDSASRICGFKSDKTVCQLVVKCGMNDLSQCQIDCEMGSSGGGMCYDADDVSCLLDAVAKESCEDLKACGWIL